MTMKKKGSCYSSSKPWRRGSIWWCLVVCVFILLSSLWLCWSGNNATKKLDTAFRSVGFSSSGKDATLFNCPQPAELQRLNHEDTFEEYLIPTKRLYANLTDFLMHYRDREYDAWGISYTSVLEGMLHWKTTKIVPHVQSGDKIYESACGIGLNLVLTMEILHQHGIHDIHLYGNEVLPESAQLANTILDKLAHNFGGQRGLVCPGDSTNLHHVPSNTFDFVWCGYISELYDPLGFYDNATVVDYEVIDAHHQELCRAPRKDWKSQKLLDIAVHRLNTWYAQWVGEMIRIAKPGKAIVIEQVRYPRCPNARPKFSGIVQDWWKQAIDAYDWDVDPDSLQFEDDEIFRKRYHVFMRKSNRSFTSG